MNGRDKSLRYCGYREDERKERKGGRDNEKITRDKVERIEREMEYRRVSEDRKGN